MSDQEFKGLNPKSKAGESIFFYSMDYWIGLRECIRMIFDERFPPYPTLDDETAEYIAEVMEHRLDFGLVRAYFDLKAKRDFDDPDEIASYVDTMIDHTRQHIDFLKNCGGCKPVWN